MVISEVVEKKLYDVASKGDVATLVQLVEEDPYLVHIVPFSCSRNLLHIATIHGQISIVEVVLSLNARLAWIPDTLKSSPLHIAAAEGHIEICQKLLAIAPETYWWRDCHDMNPVHIAAIKGHVEIVQLLLQESLLPALERLRRGETVLHLCVKHGQLTTLKVLVERLGELVNSIDENGETILHLAVRSHQLETVQYLVESNKIEKWTHNSMGKTPLEILEESPQNTTSSYSEFRRILSSLAGPSITNIASLPKLTDTTMVVAVLIATVAFQTTVNPPGGVWQDDILHNATSHTAGNAIIAQTNPDIFKKLISSNTLAFVSSLVTIFLIISGLPFANTSFLAMALGAAGVSMTSIVTSYEASIMVITPDPEKNLSDSNIGRIFNVFVITYLVILMPFLNVLGLYSCWKRKPRRQEDLTTGPLHQRILYRIFLLLETWGCLKPNR